MCVYALASVCACAIACVCCMLVLKWWMVDVGVVCSSMWCFECACACTRACFCVCVHLWVWVNVCKCVAQPENTPDALHSTESACRDWLLLRLDRHDCRKLMSESVSRSCTFCRCCAVATLESTLHHSSVVGCKCKTIQWLVLSQQVETPTYGQVPL